MSYGANVSAHSINDMSPRWPRPSEWPVWAVPLVVWVFGVVGSSGASWQATRHRGYTLGPVFLTLCVGVVTTMAAGHRLATWLIEGGEYATFFGATALLHAFDVRILPSWPLTVTPAVASLAWTLVVLIGAEFIRIRSERMAEARHTRAEEQRRRASEERLRMARELHDVLAHNISMINVQAGVALHLMDERPEQARTALAAIKEASKEALTEMRSVIGVLRQGDEIAPRAPTAGLDRLDDLVSQARTAGLRVTSSIDGQRRPLPGGVDLAAFRIVQEALTNVTRHARQPADGTRDGPVTASILITYRERDIIVQVDDNGHNGAPPAESSGGSGIPGMRERAGALGGEFTAGPLAGGGFRVWARLPVTAERTEDA